MTMFRLMLSSSFAAGFLAAASAGAANYETVKIDTGTLQGVVAGQVESFKGIPFAAPPIGPLRWRAPQPAAPWQGIRKADRFGNVCVPANDEMDNFPARPPVSEDCLSLNVWRPAGAAAKLPVLVWIHGGGLTAGSSAYPVYNGEAFAKRGIVFVSMNYRLGSLGFFAHPALSKENADGGRLANYGLMDQVAALEWVKRNIAAFGGDPGKVTIFGESAGGASVNMLMAIPSARGLFQAAMAESGYGRKPFKHLDTIASGDKTSAEQDGVAAMQSIGVATDDPAVLRAIPADKVKMTADPYTGSMFMIDGKVVTQDLWDVFREGKEAPVPFVIGANSLETPPPTGPKPAYAAKFEELAARYLKPDEHGLLVAAYGGKENLEENISSDLGFGEEARALALLHVKNGQPAYRYRFSIVADALKGKVNGAVHASELPYVFNTLSSARWKMDAHDQKLADIMTDTWVAFAKNGTPNAKGLARWEQAKDDKIMNFTDEGPKPMVDPRAAALEALARLVDDRS